MWRNRDTQEETPRSLRVLKWYLLSALELQGPFFRRYMESKPGYEPQEHQMYPMLTSLLFFLRVQRRVWKFSHFLLAGLTRGVTSIQAWKRASAGVHGLGVVSASMPRSSGTKHEPLTGAELRLVVHTLYPAPPPPEAAQTVKNLPAVWESRVRSLGWEDALQKRMATHSGILAWKMLWTEEPGGLQSVGLQRVRHNGATNTLTFASTRDSPARPKSFPWKLFLPAESLGSYAQISVIISNSNLARLGWAQAPHPTCSHSSPKTLARSPYPHDVWTRTR